MYSHLSERGGWVLHLLDPRHIFQIFLQKHPIESSCVSSTIILFSAHFQKCFYKEKNKFSPPVQIVTLSSYLVYL